MELSQQCFSFIISCYFEFLMSLSKRLLWITCCTSDWDALTNQWTACMLITCSIRKTAHVLPDDYIDVYSLFWRPISCISFFFFSFSRCLLKTKGTCKENKHWSNSSEAYICIKQGTFGSRSNLYMKSPQIHLRVILVFRIKLIQISH